MYGLLVERLRCLPFTEETRGSRPLQAISGGVTVAQRFLVPLVGVRISTGEYRAIYLKKSNLDSIILR
jgi:hypothetical protein